MFVRAQRNGDRTYLLIVENEWVEGKTQQRVLHRLGRLDVLRRTGKLDSLMQSLQRFSERLAVLGAASEMEVGGGRRIGPGMIFGRLWRELGVGTVLEDVLAGRKFEFCLERAVFLTVLHRLCGSGSDRKAEKWKEGYRIEGAMGIDLHHLYRAMGWLGEVLPAEEQGGATPFVPRCTKDVIEERLFTRRRDLFSGLDVVFFDTTSLYFEGEGGETMGRWGHSKDHRPDLKQMVVGMVLDGEGNPLCSELWPGNTADVKTLAPVVERLKRRFGVRQVCIVADRGMISQETIREIGKRGWHYLLGVRMRSSKEAKEEVVEGEEGYEEVYPKSKDPKAPSPLKVKEVRVGGHRYVVCLNPDQAEKDRHDRAAILTSLEEALRRGEKSLVGNRGYRRFLKGGEPHFEVDREKAQEEARYDGKWVLTSDLGSSAKELALRYKQLWTVEAIFRTMKSILETRPIYHKCDETIRGHVFCSFLALVLRKELEDRLARKGWTLEWADVIRDLDRIEEVEMTVSGKCYLVRTQPTPTAVKVFQACSVGLPPVIRKV